MPEPETTTQYLVRTKTGTSYARVTPGDGSLEMAKAAAQNIKGYVNLLDADLVDTYTTVADYRA